MSRSVAENIIIYYNTWFALEKYSNNSLILKTPLNS